MGGGPAGSSASSLAVQAIMQSVIHAPQGLLPEVVLTNAVIKANSLLRHTIKSIHNLQEWEQLVWQYCSHLFWQQ